jgi:hypothetical protein
MVIIDGTVYSSGMITGTYVYGVIGNAEGYYVIGD